MKYHEMTVNGKLYYAARLHCKNIRLKIHYFDDTDSSVCMAVSKGSTLISLFYSCELSQLCGTQAQFDLFIFTQSHFYD